MSNIQYLLIFIVLILSACQPSKDLEIKEIEINGQAIKAEVADTASKAKQGLSGRASLCADCGMLFEYPDYQIMSFWMNKMNFPLDIIWIKDDIVVGFEENIQMIDGQGDTTRVKSPEEVNRVLEVNAGFSANLGLKIGDKVGFKELD